MEVYCTMLLTDSYLPGAQVLAHSLRDGGATRKLAVLVTQDFLSEATMKELKRIYDYVIPVDRITNKSHGNLLMMDRLDLSSAFTKIHLWRMTQFEKIVYIDADVVALRAPEELFDTKERFSAAPDIGWPDCFNSGVMVLKPDLGTYNGLLNLANRGISFDGADQGLLNEYFRNWSRLSFVYNVTPSGHYQYAPAFNHYRSSITMAHFIGSNKPWAIGRYAGQDQSRTSAYGELLGRWWAIWDAHYRPVTEQDPALGWLSKGLGEQLTIAEIQRPNPMPTEYDPNFRREHTSFDERKDEPVVWRPPPVPGPEQKQKQQQQEHHYQPQSYQPQHYQAQQQQQHYHHHQESPPPPVFLPKEHVPYVPRDLPYNAYSQTQAPPSYSYHDNKQHQQHHIHAPQPVHPQWQEQGRRFSQEIPNRIENSLPLPPLPSVAEEQVPKEKGSPSFEAPLQQWDAGRSAPPPNSRPEASNWPSQVYANEWDQDKQDTTLFVPPRVASPPANLDFEVPAKPQPSPRPSPIFPWEHGNVTPATRVFAGEDSPSPTMPLALPGSVDDEFETEEAAGGYSARGMAGWDSYSRANAWDSIPAIDHYVASFQKSTQPRRTD
ncbi:glycogenin glucosyltransferase, variant 2 [Orbilia blumenaviensis]|uniref:glycogenin glucosyltransferase n=1 Tax=Orbilia blumenaviensis TaxID=1796055 RepID=A0AAV9VMX1_9PEZI